MKNMKKKILKIIRRINGNELIQETIDKNLAISQEIKWAQIFRDTISNSSWLINKSFSPGRWAAGYPFLYILYRTLDMIKPKSIIEFGLGETSKITTQYYDFFSNRKLMIIEHDKNWTEFYSENFGRKELINQLDLESITINGYETKVYKNLIDNINQMKFDLIIVDAPIRTNRYSRYQVVSLAANNLINDEFVIIFDDTQRVGEKDSLNELKLVLTKNNYVFETNTYSGAKETTIICSPKYSFLLSL
jgi:hypothetical protein